MQVQSAIERKLRALQPQVLRVENESGRHNVPPGAESHFKVTIVAEGFVGQSLVARHRAVNEALAEELQGGVHALAIHAFTGEEWEARGGAVSVADSPDCLGGDGGERVGSG